MPPQVNLPPSVCICRDPECKIPYGLCHCGCGTPTRIAARTIKDLGHIKGVPCLYRPGHKRWASSAGPEPCPIHGVRFIPLTRGQWAMVSEHRYETLMQWTWYAWWWPKTRQFYAVRNTVRVAGKKSRIYMHRQILGLDRGDKRRGDHIKSEQTLNNTDDNLRIGTASQNNQNKKLGSNSTSGFKGVQYSKQTCKWASNICCDGKSMRLGSFDSKEPAARAYDRKALELFGEFARLNFPDERDLRLAEIEESKKEVA